MRLVDYTLRLLGLSEALRKWHGIMAALEEGQRASIAGFAEAIAGTLARAASAFERLEKVPGDKAAQRSAIRELGRLAGYVENIVATLEERVDGRRLNGIKKRLEGLAEDASIVRAVREADSARIERLLQSEGYFRALADALRA